MLSLVITTHAPYLPYLLELSAAVEAQRASVAEVILAVDGSGQLPALPASWIIVRGDWSNPQAARNAGLAKVTQPWVAYLDGDNLPAADSLHAMRRAASSAHYTVGVLYGDVLRVAANSHAQRVFVMPEWSTLAAQAKSIVDTGSAWRTEALREAGGWPEGSIVLNDYTTVLALIRLGWHGCKVPGLVQVLRHHDQRRSLALAHAQAESLWACRKHTILTLFASNREAVFERVMNWYKRAELPPNTAIMWVDNSSDRYKQQLLQEMAVALQKARHEPLDIRVVADASRMNTSAADYVWEKHRHVGTLYNRALAELSSEVVVTLEDDVIPPLDGLRRLVQPILPWGQVAAVSGVYPSRDAPDCCVASTSAERWERLRLAEVSGEPFMDVSMVGGGFTAWHLPVMKQHALPLRRVSEPVSMGWDGAACTALSKAGYKVQLATSVRCEHVTS